MSEKMISTEKYKSHHPWIYVFAISIIFSFPLFLANSYYMDDNARALYGYSWSHSGRIFSTVLMNLLDLNIRNVSDISPLGQILGLLALSYSALFLTRRITHLEAPDPVSLCLCGLPLAVQPFFLENLSYKFDALPMLLGQSCAVMAASLLWDGALLRKLALGVFFLFSVLCFYQPCLNTFLALCVVIFVADCARNDLRTAWRTLSLEACAFIIAGIAYHFIVAKHFVHGSYEGGHAVMRDMQTLSLSSLMASISGGTALLNSLLHAGAKPLLCAFYALGSVYAVRKGLACIRQKTSLSIAAGLLAALSPVILLLLLAGIMLLLQNPVYEPRTFTAFSACVIFANLPFIFMKDHKLRLVAFLPVLYFFVISYSYGNALAEKSRFENARITHLTEILNDAGFKTGDDLFIYGNEREAPVVRNAVTIFPILAKLLPRQGLHDDDIFGYVMLRKNGADSREHSSAEWNTARKLLQNTNIVRNTPDFTLYRTGRIYCLTLQGN